MAAGLSLRLGLHVRLCTQVMLSVGAQACAQAWLLKVPQGFPGLLEAWARTMVGLLLVGAEARAQTLLSKSPRGFPRLLDA